MEGVPGEYCSYDCYHYNHSECEGFRLDSKNTIELTGGKVPSFMKMLADGKAIVESLCSCTCHDRRVLENDDLLKFLFAYKLCLDLWGFAVRVDSEREPEDSEQDIQVKEQLDNGKHLDLM